MGYMKEVDIQVREAIEAICGVVARHFPESEFRAGDWELDIEQLVYNLAERIIRKVIRREDLHCGPVR